MPAISMFYGIVIRMQSESGGKHNLPHIHAIYGSEEVVFSFDGTILEGQLPRKQIAMIQGWIAIHEEELYADWEMLSSGEGYFRIDPLR